MILFILSIFSFFSTASTCTSFISENKSFAKYTYWGFHVYDIEYIGEKSFPSFPFSLELKYKRSFKGSDIAEASEDEMKRLGASEDQLKVWADKLTKIFPDVKDGDSIRGYVDKEQKSYFCQGDKLLGEILDPEFSKYFFGIWLSEKSRRQDVRSTLVGGESESKIKK